MAIKSVLFLWKGTVQTQTNQSGLIAATTTHKARLLLYRRGVRVLRIQVYRGHWRLTDTRLITRQLASLMGSGIPLPQALVLLRSRAEKRKLMHWVLAQLLEQIQEGASLCKALQTVRQTVPTAFDDLYLRLIEVGEASATLGTVLERLADGLERHHRLQNQLRTASIYPLAVIVVATLLLAVFMAVVVPSFAQLYAGKPLPWLTQSVLHTSQWIADSGWIFGLLLGIIIFALWWAIKHSVVWKNQWQKGLLHVAGLGPLLQKNAQTRFLQTLALLLQSGVPLQLALELSAPSAGNVVYELQIRMTAKRIGLGKSLAASLSSQWFDEEIRQMVAMGEETASLDTVLKRVANLYVSEVEDLQNRMGKLLEPLLIIFLGLIIGGVILALYLPIFQVGSIL